MLARVRNTFRQFDFPDSIRVLVAVVCRRLLDPYSTETYAQTGEDRLIDALLQNRSNGFYVDVGCHYPRRFSNTFNLYKHGWRGIAVDADPDLIAAFRKERPRDIAICAAVSPVEKTIVFTRFAEPAISSANPENVERVSRACAVVDQREMRTVTLNSILEQNGVSRFDLLSVDVEGAELDVMHSLDIARFKPALVVIEIHGLDLQQPEKQAVWQHMRSVGYKMVAYAIMNAYFVPNDS